MLVRFHSDVGGFLMFGDVAVELLRLAGHSGTVPSAIRGEDVGEALRRLRGALDRRPAAGGTPRDDDDDEPPVGLRQRAVPLLELFERAAAEGCAVRWEQSVS